MYEQKKLDIVTNAIVKAAREVFGDKLDKVVLYGSYARGDYNDESDIDIMILAHIPRETRKSERRKFTHLTSNLGLEYDALISLIVADCETFEGYREHSAFYKNVSAEGVILNV